MSTSPHSRFQTPLHRRRTTISGQAPASRSICGSIQSPATSGAAHAYRLRALRRAPTHARHHAPPTDGDRRTASGARCVGSGCPVGGEVGGPCQPPRVPPNATTSPRDGLRAPVQAAHRPGHRRAAGGDATTTAPPLPDRRATRGVSSRCDPQQCSRRSPQISAGGDPKRRLFTFAFSETLRAPLPKPLAVVKWYRINAYWYKPDPPGLGEW